MYMEVQYEKLWQHIQMGYVPYIRLLETPITIGNLNWVG